MENVIISNQSTIKSTELVGIINDFRNQEGNKAELQHCDFMKKIKKELETLKNLGIGGQGNFSESSYINSQNKEQPCFELTRDGMLEMLNSESAFVRYKTIEYINKLEEKLKQKDSHLDDPTCVEDVLIKSLQEMKDLRLQLQENKTQTIAVKQEVQNMKNIITIKPSDEWRKKTNILINRICMKNKNYEEVKKEIYKALDERAASDINKRLKNMKARILLNGGTQTQVSKLNLLDVVANDKKLTEIYIMIVKEIATKYSIRI